MDIQLASRVKRIKPSPTLAVTQRAAELQAAGQDIVSLGAGEPDFDTPTHIKEAAIKAIKDGKTKYTAVDGIPSLKDAIIDKLQSFNGLDYTRDQVIVSTGGKQCIYNLLQAVIQEGDEVIIPAPYWVSYPDMVLLADGVPVFIPTDMAARFKITPEQLEAAITPKTRMLIINSPSNPSGMSYTHAELKALANVLLKHPNILIATDDMYEHILWTKEPFANIAMVCPDLLDRTIVLSGVSKVYSMTGWRIGYASGPTTIIKAMNKIQSQSTSNPTSISQYAAEAALRGNMDSVHEMVTVFKKRHDFLVEQLNAIEGIQCAPGDGTFYAFARVQDVIDRMPLINSDIQLSEHLISVAGLALVPGSAFGADGYVRLSFATSMETLEKAVERLKRGCEVTL
ncbi:aminotransferase class I/II-fold pyridoxal phosphate-dependent enzyme [Candidatus Berkiella aquae]|uniref:Aminotransferase n=1 Tax=Candidatus Berkiella aquae TaxID=295108 RepID=A0A0Q9Z0A6_9GAMM|nr:pyridoxal phosphate-dependent aminotransferase [Candidatus Berkiella aquae]MCS5711951.1 pyridoxal phosphate-dependent aminotransferase [Candidatus Berkiella aquae]